MSLIQRPCWQCDVILNNGKPCGKVWIAENPEKPPSHCARCKSRKWHQPAPVSNTFIENLEKAVERQGQNPRVGHAEGCRCSMCKSER